MQPARRMELSPVGCGDLLLYLRNMSFRSRRFLRKSGVESKLQKAGEKYLFHASAAAIGRRITCTGLEPLYSKNIHNHTVVDILERAGTPLCLYISFLPPAVHHTVYADCASFPSERTVSS